MHLLKIHGIAPRGCKLNELFGGLAILVTLLSLAGYVGSVHRYLEYTANFKHQYLLLALISVFFFALTRRKSGLLLSLMCVLLNLTEIAPWYVSPGAQVHSVIQYPMASDNASDNLTQGGQSQHSPVALVPPASSQAQPMRLLSLNVLTSNSHADDVISLVEREQPTIAAFQEVYVSWPHDLERLQTLLPYHAIAPDMGIAIYSRLPLLNISVQRYGPHRGLIASQVAIADQRIALMAVHTYSQFHFGQRGLEWRNQALAGIGQAVGQRQTQTPLLLLGDLNVTMWSSQYKAMIRQSGLKNARTGFGILPTASLFRPDMAWLSAPVDHCLVSQEVEIADVRLGPYVGSDHLPLITDVVIPPPIQEHHLQTREPAHPSS